MAPAAVPDSNAPLIPDEDQPSSSLIRPYLVALAVCVAIAGVDYACLNLLKGGGRYSMWGEYLFCAVLAVQLAFLGLAAGRTLRQVSGRWIFFIWCLLLIDLLLLTRPGSFQSLRYAFYSAQQSLLVLWCFLGRAPWTGRMLVAIVTMPLALSAILQRGGGWGLILLVHLVVVTSVCAVGWTLGFRLRRVESMSDEELAGGKIRFAMRDILIWMIAIGPAALVIRSLSWIRVIDQDLSEFGLAVLLGMALTSTIICTLWVTMNSFTVLRLTAAVLVLPSIVGGMIWAGYKWKAQGPMITFRQQVTLAGAWMESDWIALMVLLNLFLAAALVCFRADGQRLIQVGRS
ncbi:MAG: hypothetical protein QGG36_15275 [Pirellulaceae bacterium]|jgi:hypothetical protein|nr:hypothetical protein [Pirellulaceae bacterium]MDP7017165.1 hypothetical protein [Pirellulaceae bacterium]